MAYSDDELNQRRRRERDEHPTIRAARLLVSVAWNKNRDGKLPFTKELVEIISSLDVAVADGDVETARLRADQLRTLVESDPVDPNPPKRHAAVMRFRR